MLEFKEANKESGGYQIIFKCGVLVESNAKTLQGVKRQASKLLSYELGSVEIHKDSTLICEREFWEGERSFGWRNWKMS